MKPLTAAQKKLQDELMQTMFDRGHRQGIEEGKRLSKEEFERRKDEMHLKALDSIARIGSALGQSIDAINRSMQSDRGQL